MEIEAVETKGYEFYWDVAADGYELVDKALYEFRGAVTGTPFGRYYPDRIFFGTELLARRWHGELKATFIDTLAPWLVLKGMQARHREFELVAEGKIPAKDLKGIPIPSPRVYEPLSDPVLHRKFASLKTEDLETEGLRFSNKYGLLGRTFHLHPVKPVSPPVDGESLYRWRAEIEKMGVLLAIWDWVRKDDVGKLGQIVIWPSPHAVVVRFKWKSQKGHYEILPWADEKSEGYSVEELLANDEVLPNDAKPSSFFRQYKRGDVIGPARHYICRMLNYHLHEIRPCLVPWLGYKVAFLPNTLLDALWLMFMLEVDGTVRTCWYCGGPLEPTRKDNIYCSNTCKRMAFYYNKQRKGGTP